MIDITTQFAIALGDGRYDRKKLSHEKSESQIAPSDVLEGTLFGGQYKMQSDTKKIEVTK